MKHIYTILVLTILIFSCGSDKKKSVEDVIATNNLEAIRAKKDQIISKQIEIVEQLKQLDAKIDELDTTKTVALISTFTVTEEVFNHHLELQGNVSTTTLLVIYPEYTGILSKVYDREGQYVKYGQILAKMDDGG